MPTHARLLVCVCCASMLPFTTAVEAGEEEGAAAKVRPDDDPPKGKVRLLLLAPTGPLVIEAAITIGGRPFHVVQEQFIDEVLEAADSNGDGKGTWEEAIKNPRLAFGRLGWRLRNAGRRFQLMKSCDRNGNGMVERDEARLLMEAAGDGPAFRLQELHRIRNGSEIDQLLDLNQDRVLSKPELTNAEDRLKSRDTNNNDWLESRELPLFINRNLGRRTIDRTGIPGLTPTGGPRVLHRLGPTVNVAVIEAQMMLVYGKKHDVSRFQTATPHFIVRASLGERDQAGRGIEVTSSIPELKNRTSTDPESALAAELSLSGTKLRFAIGVVNRRPPDFDDLARREMTLRDEDGNGVLEGGELDALANTALAQAYGRWDSNRDGRATLTEIKADYRREHAVRWSQAEVTTAAEIPTLFQLVDLNGDQRLSLREMRGARRQILKLDEDGDGAIKPEERHGRITIVFSRAHEKYSTDVFRIQQVKRATASRKEGNPPKWFLRMDRNHDNDISPREFLGSSKVFDRIDRDGDGLIDHAEAGKAGDGR